MKHLQDYLFRDGWILILLCIGVLFSFKHPLYGVCYLSMAIGVFAIRAYLERALREQETRLRTMHNETIRAARQANLYANRVQPGPIDD